MIVSEVGVGIVDAKRYGNMETDKVLAQRFTELHVQMGRLQPRRGGSYGESEYYETSEWQKWTTSVQHLVRQVFGEHSAHCENFSSLYAKCNGWADEVNALMGVFLAAKEDFEGGYTFSLHERLSGEILGDFVSLANASLSEGAKDVAAVLACAALEDALKRFAVKNGIDVSEKTLREVVNALKANGLVSGAQKTLLDSMPKIRDYAMHANWEKVTEQDVGAVIGFVQQFLLAKFS